MLVANILRNLLMMSGVNLNEDEKKHAYSTGEWNMTSGRRVRIKQFVNKENLKYILS